MSVHLPKRRISDEFGFRAYKPTRKPRLTPSMKAERYAFAMPRLDWTAKKWRMILVSDGSLVHAKQRLTTKKAS